MEAEINFLSEGITDTIMLESCESNVYLNIINVPDPKGDDDEDDDKDTDETDDTSNDDPPLDDDVVHSPVTTQPGGRPKS